MTVVLLKHNIFAGLMFSDEQLTLIVAAIEDYAMLVDEDSADDCDEIITIIEAHFLHKNNVFPRRS